MTRRRKQRTRTAQLTGHSGVHGPTPELVDHLELDVHEEAFAGRPAILKRSPAHRRLAKAKKIKPDVETYVELFAQDWEMVVGGAHKPGEGEGDRRRTRDEVFTIGSIRIDQARDRIGPDGIAIVVLSCVECEPAWMTARRMGYQRDPDSRPKPIVTKRQQQAAREWLDVRLVPILTAMAGFKVDTSGSEMHKPVSSPEMGKEHIAT